MKKVLLVGEFFWPSLGGIEVFLGDLGQELIKAGMAVEVATTRRKERESRSWRGIKIHEFDHWRLLNNAGQEELTRLINLIMNGNYDSVVILSHPDGWSMNIIAQPQPRPKMIFMPIINLANIGTWTVSRQLPLTVQCIGLADHVVRITESSCDAQLFTIAGVESKFIPHGIRQENPEVNFREHIGLAEDVPLFVMVANYWPVKNHIPLIQTVSNNLKGDWHLAIMGSPHVQGYFRQVCKTAEGDKRITVLPRQPREVASAAIRDADGLLLASAGEGCPLVILQAMSHGTPWIATPECGSVHEQAGGVVTPLNNFPDIMHRIITNKVVAEKLGGVGKAHWERSFAMDRVVNGFVDIINGKEPELKFEYDPALKAVNQKMVQALLK
ncbi:glycosyltransferase family 4 protein [Desulfovibrio sp. JC010]|uniref:glycosyltransferase family 4 protein n=1 Tax=Desulfovibrio sp. JC010 TaxID=2593641 RepID=UPI0013D02390|nr:glycosyltransferase family 4 protein [Desulfovibrio sp. JC010]